MSGDEQRRPSVRGVLSAIPEGSVVHGQKSGRRIRVGDEVTEDDGDLIVTSPGTPPASGIKCSLQVV